MTVAHEFVRDSNMGSPGVELWLFLRCRAAYVVVLAVVMALFDGEFIKVGSAALFHPVALLGFVVVFIDHVLGGVHPLSGHLAGDTSIAVPRDRTRPDVVRST